MTSEQRRSIWQDHHTSWRQSGLSQRSYCQQHGLSYSTFSYWRKRLTAEPHRAASKLIPVELASSRANVILFAGSLRMEVPALLLPEVLPLVWRTLRDTR